MLSKAHGELGPRVTLFSRVAQLGGCSGGRVWLSLLVLQHFNNSITGTSSYPGFLFLGGLLSGTKLPLLGNNDVSPNNNKTKKGAETGISEFLAKTLMLQKNKAAKVPRKKSPGKGVTIMVLPPHDAQGIILPISTIPNTVYRKRPCLAGLRPTEDRVKASASQIARELGEILII